MTTMTLTSFKTERIMSVFEFVKISVEMKIATVKRFFTKPKKTSWIKVVHMIYMITVVTCGSILAFMGAWNLFWTLTLVDLIINAIFFKLYQRFYGR